MKDPERLRFLSEQARIYRKLIDTLEETHPGLGDLSPEGNHPLAIQSRQLLNYRQVSKDSARLYRCAGDE